MQPGLTQIRQFIEHDIIVAFVVTLKGGSNFRSLISLYCQKEPWPELYRFSSFLETLPMWEFVIVAWVGSTKLQRDTNWNI